MEAALGRHRCELLGSLSENRFVTDDCHTVDKNIEASRGEGRTEAV